MPSFIEIVQRVKKLNSISRKWLNFRRRAILCTTLYRNPMQASNFGGAFDQLFLWIFYEIFTEDASLLLLYHCAKTSKLTKTQVKGGPALSGFLFFVQPLATESTENKTTPKICEITVCKISLVTSRNAWQRLRRGTFRPRYPDSDSDSDTQTQIHILLFYFIFII